jgi:ankyrin repeat protein
MMTKLINTVSQWQEAIVQLLLEKGANINAKAYWSRWTALYWAATNGHEAVVPWLLEKGANVNAKDVSEWNTL